MYDVIWKMDVNVGVSAIINFLCLQHVVIMSVAGRCVRNVMEYDVAETT